MATSPTADLIAQADAIAAMTPATHIGWVDAGPDAEPIKVRVTVEPSGRVHGHILLLGALDLTPEITDLLDREPPSDFD